MVERKSRIVVYLFITGERRSRVTGSDGGGLTVEFYKSATTLARETFGCRMGVLLDIVQGIKCKGRD